MLTAELFLYGTNESKEVISAEIRRRKVADRNREGLPSLHFENVIEYRRLVPSEEDGRRYLLERLEGRTKRPRDAADMIEVTYR